MAKTIPNEDDIRKAFREESQKLLEEHRQLLEDRETLLTRQEVADLLGVSLSTVHSYAKKGILRKHRIGDRQVRFFKSEVLEAFDEVKSHEG